MTVPPTPTPTASVTATATSTATAAPTPTPTPTATPTVTSTVTSTATPTATPQPAPTKTPAKFWQKVTLCVILVVLGSLVLWATQRLIVNYNTSSMAAVTVDYDKPAQVTLKPGPPAFSYDARTRQLSHHGPISNERKLELLALFEMAAPGDAASQAPGNQPAAGAAPPPTPGTGQATTAAPATGQGAAPAPAPSAEAARASYNAVIDSLTYKASTSQQGLIGLLLWLGVLGGALGALLRSLNDFVGNAAYKRDELDLYQWWPLYATRPVVGGIIGFVVVVMFKAKLLTGADVQLTDDSLTWLGVTVLAGFSTVDVTERLRAAAKALFGEAGRANPPPKADTAKEAAEKEGKKNN